MHIDEQRAAGDDLDDLADLFGAPAGAGDPASRPSCCQGGAPGLAAMHEPEHGRTGHEAAGGHRRRLHDLRGAPRHDLTGGRRLPGEHRDGVDNL
jgi:hypothetical protein